MLTFIEELAGVWLTWALCVFNLGMATCSWIRNRVLPALMPTQPAFTPYPQLKPGARIAVVVPALNEEDGIGRTLRACYERAEDKSRIVFYVSLGLGTNDGTAAVARATARKLGFELHVLEADLPGRGPPHMIAGIRASAENPGSVVMFLHADVMMPKSWDSHICKAFQEDKRTVGGCFRFGCELPPANELSEYSKLEILALQVTDWMYGFRVRLLNCNEGDHAPFIRSEAYLKMGGHPAWPLLEDLEFQRRAWQMTATGARFTVVPAETQCDPRRWLKKGVLKVTWLNTLVYTMHWVFGWSGHKLFRVYYGKCPEEVAGAPSPRRAHRARAHVPVLPKSQLSRRRELARANSAHRVPKC